jgi:hypothetical protein
MIEKIKRKFHTIKDQLWFDSKTGKENYRRLENLKDIYKGRRVFILGNGPSLLKCDLTLLKDEITIVSNANFLIWDKMGFIPNILTVEDRLVAEDRKEELNNLRGIKKIFPKDLSYVLKYDSDTIYLNFLRGYLEFPKFSASFEKEVYWGGTVSYLNMQLANFLGGNEIYLIGFDHSYKVPEKMNNTVITSETEDVNHIHPDYFGKGYRWHDPKVDRMEMAYLEAKVFLESKGVKIYNSTVGGKLEVFERVDYNTLFKK